MSNTSNQNIPNPDDKHRSNSSDQGLESTSEQNLHNRFLQDISSVRHLPDLKQSNNKESRITLIEAIFNATILRAIGDTVKELRLLGGSFINKSVLLGLSKDFGQSPYLNALKGEILDSTQYWDRESRQRILKLQSEKKAKEKDTKNIKETQKEQKQKEILSKQSKVDNAATKRKEEQELKEQELLEENEPERISNQDYKTEPKDKRYNIVENIRKATEFELSMLPSADSPKSLFGKLEQSKTTDFGGVSFSKDTLTLSIDRLKHCIEQFSRGRILVLGDLLIDELLEGKAERISREAPVLILEHVDTVLIPGGAANAAHNVAALGGQCHAVGIVGEDDYATKLMNILDKYGIKHSLIVDPSRKTTVKTRILSKSHSLLQQLLRLDRISREPINSGIETLVVANLENIAKDYPVLILSDYRAGLITDGVIHACKKIAAKQDLMLIVDAQDQFERFQNAKLLTPNQPDTEKAVGYKINNQSELLQAGEDMLLLTGAQAVLITRGPEGMSLFQRGIAPIHLPAFNRSEVFDVSGAGDTVVATIALALSTGATFAEAIALGNIAASIVVTKPGTAVTSQKEMLDLLPSINLST